MTKKFTSFLVALTMLSLAMALALAEPLPLGPVYPVIEPDLLALLKTHAKEEIAQSTSRINRNKGFLESWSKHPQGQSLPLALEIKRFRFESKGDVYEVLGKDFKRDWLFIDAHHSEHVTLAQAFMKAKPMGRVL